VIVGDAAVVKWATTSRTATSGAAPDQRAARRRLRGMPAPWGLVTWHTPGGAETLVANVDEYLPGAVDGGLGPST